MVIIETTIKVPTEKRYVDCDAYGMAIKLTAPQSNFGFITSYYLANRMHVFLGIEILW